MKVYTKEELRERTKSSAGRARDYIHATGPDAEEWMYDFNNYTEGELALTERISVSYNTFTSLDLSNLKHCHRLKELHISDTNLCQIDLSFLENKPLEELILSGNRLETINLSPLKRCFELKNLFIGGNNFRAIDLSPLKGLYKLEALWMGANKLREISFEHLEELILKSLNITSFEKHDELDFSPLYKNSIEELYYSLENEEGDEVSPFISDTKTIYYTKEEKYCRPYNMELDSRCENIGEKRLVDKTINQEIEDYASPLYIKNTVFKLM